MDPINYITQVANPLQMALGGYESAIGQAQTRQNMQFANSQEDRAAQTFEAEKKAYDKSLVDAANAKAKAAEDRARGDAALTRLIDLGTNATTKDYLIAIAENPAYKDSLKTVFDSFGAERQGGEVQFGSQLFSALKNNPEVAKTLIEERRVAAEASGDQQTADTMKSFKMILDQPGGAETLRATVGTTLAGVMGGEEFKAVMEAIGVGKEPDVFDLESKIRKEYTTLTADYRTVVQAYDRIVASQPNGVGDVSLLFGFMKMLDPMTGIREGEVATAQNTAGVPERVRNLYNQARLGELLSEDQRAQFKSQAADLLGAAKKSEESARSTLMPTVEYYKLDPTRVFGSPSEVEVGAGADGAPTEVPATESFLTDPVIVQAAKDAGVTPERMWAVMTPEQRAQYGG